MSEEAPPTRTDASYALPSGDRGVAARTLIEERLRGVRRSVDRDLAPVDVVLRPTRSESRTHLFEEACELYWTELGWEEETGEEAVGSGGAELTEMVFPGLLAFMDALLPRNTNGEPDRDREHRDVAHDFLLWLAGRLVELRSARPEALEERARMRRQEATTDELIDLVAYRLYGLTSEEVERIQER
ncbi:MAG: hypothetical protein Q8W51_08055 [Candidatus Palauibacterales bacterium]|nr:hypothetical protein [Candidatus Palauibacterales bacterium]MDP2584092.1 hypothetical protein [Candidatus Palauibacterales bacterium]